MSLIEVDAAWVRPRLPVRTPDSNKGTYGRVLVIGGSDNYIGAPALSALAAYRVGAGLVTLCVPHAIKSIVAQSCREATFISFDVAEVATLTGVKAVVIGPGLGQSTSARAFHQAYFAAPLDVPHVIDADALNLLAPLAEHASQLPKQVVITPHPGEMSRLTQRSTADIQANRAQIAHEHARQWGCVVLLKGAGTLVAAPDEDTAQLPFANPAMAVAGTGDVLAGAIGGLLAQGLAPFDAAICGAFVHGTAGDHWRLAHGDAGLLASDLLDLLPDVLHRVVG
jgi:NAD(P)H-hydrate epimerase